LYPTVWLLATLSLMLPKAVAWAPSPLTAVFRAPNNDMSLLLDSAGQGGRRFDKIKKRARKKSAESQGFDKAKTGVLLPGGSCGWANIADLE
jgi:hypothetical protein